MAALAAVLVASAGSAATPPLGMDIANLNLCLYGDCEARGAYAADPWGWANPASMTAVVLDYVPRGAFASMGYFRMNSGGVETNIEAPSLGAAYDPFVLLVSPVYAEASGRARMLPGLDLDLRTRSVRLAAAVDLERALGVPGLSLGLLGGVPGLTTDLRLHLGDLLVARATEHQEVNLTLGAHWRAGRDHWFMAGGLVTAVHSSSVTDILGVRQHGRTDAWFPRVGLSILPFVPLGLADGTSPVAEWLREIRLAGDGEYRNITVTGEGTQTQWIGYFGLDARVLPDAWNPLSDWVRLVAIGGVDTESGWGAGGGIVGNGPLSALSCNPAYSSRPLTPVLGRRTDIWAATCAVSIFF